MLFIITQQLQPLLIIMAMHTRAMSDASYMAPGSSCREGFEQTLHARGAHVGFCLTKREIVQTRERDARAHARDGRKVGAISTRLPPA